MILTIMMTAQLIAEGRIVNYPRMSMDENLYEGAN